MFNNNPGKQSFIATGGQVDFDFNFKIYANVDLKVYLTPEGQDPDDTTDLLTLTTDYTVVIDGDDGGTVTLTSGATLNDTIVIARDLDATRDISYVTNGDLKAATLNLDQDYQTYLIIDGFVALASSIQLPQSAVNVSSLLPNVVGDAYLKWNAAGTQLENDTTIPQSVIDAAASAAAALVSENAAAASALAASTSETNAGTSETNAAASALAASTSETNAGTSETNAAASALAASTSETNAATSETNAGNSASAASTSETNAATSETNAANSASAASTSETNAAASEAAAEAAYDDFDDRYLGAKASDPTLDNDGDPLITGALYFNTTSNVMKVYNGAAWIAIEGFNSNEVAYDDDTSSFISNTLASGAIIERGSNANGEYIKYVDGTMICKASHANTTSGSASNRYGTGSGTTYFNATTRTFPVAFVDTPKVSVTVNDTPVGGIVPYAYADIVSSSTVAVMVLYYQNGVSIPYDYIAIGRWK